jgi:amino acid adenylation domain-containing protein
MPKSLEAIIAMLGTMRAGAAYVPVDPAAPMLRVRSILAAAGVAALVTTPDEVARRPGMFDADGAWLPGFVVLAHVPATPPLSASSVAPQLAPGMTNVMSLDDVLRSDTDAVPELPVDDDLAYILYTSGSTGQPKGVMLSHGNALAFVRWAARDVALRPVDRLSSHAPFHFDLSVFDLYAAFLAGASVHLVPGALCHFPIPLTKWVAEHGITVWYSVPSILAQMAAADAFTSYPTRLRTVIFAGEVFPIPALRQLQRQLPGVELLNWYGPTETNVCTYYRLEGLISEDRREPLPIGVACPYADLLVVTDDLREAALGEEGELWVRGASVLQGYWADPERTSSALAHDPRQGKDAGRFYRTGDIVRWRGPHLTLIGRRDAMIKVRGYRIELGDVEAALFDHPDVADAAAVPVTDAKDQVRLLAAVVPRAGTALTDTALRHHCAARIPRYMVPERFLRLAELPRTSTGKVDRVGLARQLRHTLHGTAS